jgi:hypothetical protein
MHQVVSNTSTAEDAEKTINAEISKIAELIRRGRPAEPARAGGERIRIQARWVCAWFVF